MEQAALNDRSVEPTDELIFSIIRDKKLLWQELMEYLDEKHPEVSKVWKYYNDGKSWLFRTLNKKTTIFWLNVLDGGFRVAFYFSDKVEHLVLESGLPENIKKDFKNAKKTKMGQGAIRSIVVNMKDKKDVDIAIQLIEVKMKM